MYRLFSNLITNAIDALGSLQQQNKKITVAIRKDGKNKISMEISDNGPGICKENLEKIFEPFFTTKASSGGTGTGLVTVKNIVSSNLKGTINVQSEPGKGTSFKILFPIAPDQEK